MTYQHALRYICASDQPDEPHLAPRALHSLLHRDTVGPILVYIPEHKQTDAAAQLLRSILLQANIACLHVIDTKQVTGRDAFLLDGMPISPPLICEHAHAVHELELSLRRSTPPVNERQATVFAAAPRCATVLLRCAQSQECRVILFEGSSDSPLLRALVEMIGQATGIALVAPTSDRGQVLLPFVKQTITHACGPAMYRALSDACAHNGSRLTLIAKTNMRRRLITLGSQLLDYGEFNSCRLPCGSALTADAAALAIEAALALRRGGLNISNEDVLQGLSRTVLTHCCTLSSIQPLLLTEHASNSAELTLIMRDLIELQEFLPMPRRLWLDPNLRKAFEPYEDFVAEILDSKSPLDLQLHTTTLLIGSHDFLRRTLENRTKSKKKT